MNHWTTIHTWLNTNKNTHFTLFIFCEEFCSFSKHFSPEISFAVLLFCVGQLTVLFGFLMLWVPRMRITVSFLKQICENLVFVFSWYPGFIWNRWNPVPYRTGKSSIILSVFFVSVVVRWKWHRVASHPDPNSLWTYSIQSNLCGCGKESKKSRSFTFILCSRNHWATVSVEHFSLYSIEYSLTFSPALQYHCVVGRREAPSAFVSNWSSFGILIMPQRIDCIQMVPKSRSN